jgi:ABC-type dipeptide/oligopeptide/nickel transport system ATPase component
MLEPTILIVDEPSNHIISISVAFRLLYSIHALSNFDGARIIVSHDQEFIQQIGPSETVINMGKGVQNAAVTADSTKLNSTLTLALT